MHVQVQYCSEKYGTVPYSFLNTLIQIFQRIIGIEWIMISWWQYDLVRSLYGTVTHCSTLLYRSVIVSHHHYFVNLYQGHFGYIFHLRIVKMQMDVDILRFQKIKIDMSEYTGKSTNAWYWCALCWRPWITCIVT